MGSIHHEEDSINSNEEVDQPEVGTGRSYECVFCKRGFTTAQALGGHMNIHRKDRARNRPSSANSKSQENYAGPRFYHAISSYPPHYSAAHQAQMHYRTFFPASTSSVRPPFYNNNALDQIPLQRTIPIGEDWRVSLSLFGAVHGEDEKKKKHGGSEEDGLDLELRLGSIWKVCGKGISIKEDMLANGSSFFGPVADF